MDRLQIALNILAQQRNNALDAFVNTQADLAIAQEELAAARARIAELEPKPEVPAQEERHEVLP